MGYQEDQKEVATGVTDGAVMRDLAEALKASAHDRNEVLEEVAKEFDRMIALGDTAASFAVFVRGMKK